METDYRNIDFANLLTIKQRHEFYKEMLDVQQEAIIESKPSGLCNYICRVLLNHNTREDYIRIVTTYPQIIRLFPELLKHKPEYGGLFHWFDLDDQQTRTEIIEQAIKETKQEGDNDE